MKKCLKCNRTFTDDGLSYCLDDGALLSVSFGQHQTQRMSYRAKANAPTVILNPGQPQAEESKQAGNRIWIYIVISVLSIGTIGGLVLFLTRDKNTSVVETPLVGTWSVSAYISPAEVAKKSEEPLPEGMSLEMSLSGSANYHIGDKYNQEGEITLRIRRGEEEAPLRFYVREAGVWKIHNDVLVETVEDSSITPLDDRTKEFLEAVPQFKPMMSPVKGETTSYKLKKVSDSKILLEEQEFGSTIVLQRKTSVLR
ncbi:MAG TPA: hypothetical protein VJV21_02940 [Pyrinomonadaceae bacterium]|nr:hypothetical protein [Pyrinomonadaceae bacterium]